MFRGFGTQGIYEMVWMGAGDLSLLIQVVYTHYLYYSRPGKHMTVPRKITAYKKVRQPGTEVGTERGYST